MVTVYSSTDPRQAAMVQLALRDAGIQFEVSNETSSYAVGLPTPAVPIEVLVRKEDQQSAIRAIEQVLRAIGEGPHPR